MAESFSKSKILFLHTLPNTGNTSQPIRKSGEAGCKKIIILIEKCFPFKIIIVRVIKNEISPTASHFSTSDESSHPSALTPPRWGVIYPLLNLWYEENTPPPTLRLNSTLSVTPRLFEDPPPSP